MCLLNPGLIIDLFQLQVAISRAVSNRASGQMATKNIYSEILYCLSPSKNIVESFKLFGAVEQSSSLIVVTFDICEQINEVVKGMAVGSLIHFLPQFLHGPLSSIASPHNSGLIRFLQGISEI